jgi:hypothetical protein
MNSIYRALRGLRRFFRKKDNLAFVIIFPIVFFATIFLLVKVFNDDQCRNIPQKEDYVQNQRDTSKVISATKAVQKTTSMEKSEKYYYGKRSEEALFSTEEFAELGKSCVDSLFSRWDMICELGTKKVKDFFASWKLVSASYDQDKDRTR